MKELSLHLLDLIENSVAAGATRVALDIEEDVAADRLTISVADNGKGMSEETVARAADPFFSTRETRKIGLGLALLSAAAEQAGGGMHVSSRPEEGSLVITEFVLSHVDRAPLGRLEDTLATVVVLHPELDLHLVHVGRHGSYSLATLEFTGGRRPAEARRKIAQQVQEGRRRIGSMAYGTAKCGFWARGQPPGFFHFPLTGPQRCASV